MKQPSSPQRDYRMLPSKTCQAHHLHGRQPNKTFRWVPPGGCGRGRPWLTWHRTFHYDLKALCIAWDKGEALAGNRNRWRDLVAQYAR